MTRVRLVASHVFNTEWALIFLMCLKTENAQITNHDCEECRSGLGDRAFTSYTVSSSFK